MPPFQTRVADLHDAFVMSGGNDKFGPVFLHPGKDLLVIAPSIHPKVPFLARKDPTRSVNGTLEYTVLAERVFRFIRIPIGITNHRNPGVDHGSCNSRLPMGQARLPLPVWWRTLMDSAAPSRTHVYGFSKMTGPR